MSRRANNGAIVGNAQQLGTIQVGGNIPLSGIDEKDLRLFWAIPRMTDEQKIAFLCDMINGGLKEILYNDPKLIMEYVNEAS